MNMYVLFEPCGRLPMARTKQVKSVIRYSHSKITPRIRPALPNWSALPKAVVKIRKTRKKLPCGTG